MDDGCFKKIRQCRCIAGLKRILSFVGKSSTQEREQGKHAPAWNPASFLVSRASYCEGSQTWRDRCLCGMVKGKIILHTNSMPALKSLSIYSLQYVNLFVKHFKSQHLVWVDLLTSGFLKISRVAPPTKGGITSDRTKSARVSPNLGVKKSTDEGKAGKRCLKR